MLVGHLASESFLCLGSPSPCQAELVSLCGIVNDRYLLTGLLCSRWASLELGSTNQMNLVQTLNWKLVIQKSRSHPESILVWGRLHPAY